MAEPKCGTCPFRARYERNPRSILGRLWRWHANFCPGWKAYMALLPQEEKEALIARYGFPPGKFV